MKPASGKVYTGRGKPSPTYIYMIFLTNLQGINDPTKK